MGNVDTSFANRVLRDMNTGVLVLNKQGTIIYTNKPARKMLEIGKNETLDYFSLFMDIIKDDSEASAYNDGFNEYIFQSIYSKSETHLGRVKFMSPSGVKRSFEMTTSYLENDENEDDDLYDQSPQLRNNCCGRRNHIRAALRSIRKIQFDLPDQDLCIPADVRLRIQIRLIVPRTGQDLD